MSIEAEVVIRRSWRSVPIWFGPLLLVFVAFAVINQLTFSGDDWLGAAIWPSVIAILLIEVIAFKQMSVGPARDALVVRNLRRSEIPIGRIRESACARAATSRRTSWRFSTASTPWRCG